MVRKMRCGAGMLAACVHASWAPAGKRAGREMSHLPPRVQPECPDTRCDVMLVNRFRAGLGPAPQMLLYGLAGIKASTVSYLVHYWVSFQRALTTLLVRGFQPTRLDFRFGKMFPDCVDCLHASVLRFFFQVDLQHACFEQMWLPVSLKTSPSVQEPVKYACVGS